MTRKFISELQPNEPVDAIFIIKESQLRTTKAGGFFLHLVLQDKTGQITARLWDASEAFAGTLAPDEFIVVKGKCESYQNQLQINVKTITKAPTDGLRLGDFMPASAFDPAEMMRDLKELLASIEDPDYKAVVNLFLEDRDFCAEFWTAPAAKENHHSYLGGLLEHTLSMMRLASKICEHYTHLRRDLLLAGVFLHDVGKVQELSYRRTFQYTTPGNLVGHIMLGVLMLEERVKTLPEFPVEKLNLLRHLILSHHGELEFGSPKLPMCAEAMALHYVDNLDAKMKDFTEIVAEDKGGDEDWTEFSRRLGRRLYKG